MGEVITAKDKEYEAEERATAPGANQSMSDRVNNRSLRPQSAAFKEFMKSGWADDDPEINPLESSKFTPARLEALGKAFPGERLVIPAGQPKVRNNDCDSCSARTPRSPTTPVWVPITRPAPCWS